jgi:hypothetical protein
MTVLNSFWKLPERDKKLLLGTLFLMLKIRLMLWFLPFSHIQRSLKQVNPVKSDTPISRLIWSVRMVNRYVPRATCLTDALTGNLLLSKHGYPSLVKIGVGKSTTGEFEAHAWLEYEGEVVIGESEKEYVPLFDFHK